MRDLAQSKVLQSSGLAALLTALACYPRLLLWPGRPQLLGVLESILFFCTFILWAFVFAWHTKYTRRPVFPAKISNRLLGEAIAGGIIAAAILHLCFDPSLKLKLPDDYPANYPQWIAMILFSLAFQQLFLIYAPFAFFARLFQSERAALHLTVLFSVAVILLKTSSVIATMPPFIAAGFVAVRVLVGFLTLYFYLRGGIFLVCCWSLIIQLRHLLDL